MKLLVAILIVEKLVWVRPAFALRLVFPEVAWIVNGAAPEIFCFFSLNLPESPAASNAYIVRYVQIILKGYAANLTDSKTAYSTCSTAACCPCLYKVQGVCSSINLLLALTRVQLLTNLTECQRYVSLENAIAQAQTEGF